MAAAWVGLVAMGEMRMAGVGIGAVAAFEGAWLVMMTAMMLPTAMPLVLLLRTAAASGRAGEATALAVAGYLALWGVAGGGAYAASVLLEPTTPAVAGVLLAAGTYQLTPLKAWCLRRCRSPVSFLMTHWGSRSRLAPLRLGALHGIHCVGCCWALMLVLVVALGMGLAWVALVTGLVLVEKVMPGGERWARPLGFAFVALAAVVVVDPGMFGLSDGAAMQVGTAEGEGMS